MLEKALDLTRNVLVSLTVIVSGVAWAELPSRVTAEQAGSKVNAAPSSGMVTRTGQSGLIIRVYNSCFGTNLRNAGNPLAPDSIITATVNMKIGETPLNLRVRYPSTVATPEGVPSTLNANIDPSNIAVTDKDGKPLEGVKGGIHGNLIQLNLPTSARATASTTGEVTTEFLGKASVSNYSFEQEIVDCSKPPAAVYGAEGYSSYIPTYPCGEYMGKTGPLHTSIKGLNVSSDGSAVEFQVAFPGQTGFCGGFWSPLMVFFDEKRPAFTQTSEFPLNPLGRTYWPEAGHPGYFLATDVNGDGKISMAGELFGDREGKKANGFETLRAFDTNKDGVISAADRGFNRLVLWQFKYGDGRSQKNEMMTLKEKGITSVSLKYKEVLRPLGRNAEERETAEFTYKVRGKGEVKGQIADVWLAPEPPAERAAASEK